MNDMRLPGVSPFSADALTNTGTEAARDPAQAFDAVMSRFAGERPRPNPTTAQDKPRDVKETQGAKAAPAERTRATDQPAKTPAPDNAAANNNAAANGNATANGKPVSRTKPAASDDDFDPADASATPAATASAATTDPALLAALAATMPGVALQAQGVTATGAEAEAAGTQAGKEQKATAAEGMRSPLDVLAREVNAGRKDGKPGNDPRAAIGEDGESAVAAPNTQPRRAPVGAKDTLRIDAPVMRATESVQAEFAQRMTAGAGPLARGTAAIAAAKQADATPTTLTAAIAAATGTSNSTATYSIAHAAVGAPVGSPAFGDELAQRVVMFAGQKLQRADIAVTPADLGPIAVSIEVRGQEATLAFTAASHTTRAAIEDALPKLRDMLSAQGLQLAGAHVGSEPRRDSYRSARNDTGNTGARRSNDGVTAVAAADTPVIRRRMNLIDIEV